MQGGRKKRILVVSHYFPPLNQIGGLRLAFWTKYLSREGYLVDVLTSDKRGIPEPKDINFSFPKGVSVYEVAADLPGLANLLKRADAAAVLGARGEKSVVKSALKGLRGSALKLLGSLATPTWLYMRAFLHSARKLMSERSYDALITSYSPGVSHLVGYWIKKKQPSLVWVADFRDPWFGNPITPASPPFSFLEGYLERICVNSADILTVVSDSMRGIYRSRYPHKCVVTLPNGFDPDEHPDWKKRLLYTQDSLSSKRTTPNLVEIFYTGTIYPGYRDPTPLFRALVRLRSRHPEGKVRVFFLGARASYALDLARGFGVQDSVEYLGHVPRSEAMALQKRASALLLLGNPDRKSDFVLTGKVFEYLVSGRPILAVGFPLESELGRLLREWGVGINCGTDEQCIQDFLESILRLGYWPDYKPNIQLIEKFSYESLSKRLVSLLEEGCEKD